MTELTPLVQESLVCLRCFDQHGAVLVRALVPPALHDPYYREIAEAAEKYFIQFKRVPGEHALDLIENLKVKFPDKKDVYQELYASMLQTKDTINRDYVVGQAAAFAREQGLKTAIQKAVDVMQSGGDDYLNKAESIMAAAVRARVERFDPGLLLNDPLQALTFLDRREEDVFPTGIELFDKYDLGPSRKTLHVLMALVNRGKSWWLTNLGRHAMLNGRRVLHVTCEMSAEQVAMRYVQTLFSVSKRDEAIKRVRLKIATNGVFAGFEEEEMKKRPYLADPKIRGFLTGKLSNLKHRPPLIIKKFPSGQLTVDGLLAYMDALELSEKFVPDLVCVDYPDIFKQDPQNLRTSIGQTYINLRGIADERNLAMAAVTQSNRQGLDAKLLSEKHAAEDITKINTADTVITYNQTDEEQRNGLARLWTAKVRSDQKHQQVLISQAYGVGQFALQAVEMRDEEYWKELRDFNHGGEDDDDTNDD